LTDADGTGASPATISSAVAPVATAPVTTIVTRVERRVILLYDDGAPVANNASAAPAGGSPAPQDSASPQPTPAPLSPGTQTSPPPTAAPPPPTAPPATAAPVPRCKGSKC
jgi:hypothetical protein